MKGVFFEYNTEQMEYECIRIEEDLTFVPRIGEHVAFEGEVFNVHGVAYSLDTDEVGIKMTQIGVYNGL